MKRITGWAATAIASLTLLTTALPITGVAAEEPVRGGTLIQAVQGTPRHLNPAVQSGIATGQPGAQLRGTAAL